MPFADARLTSTLAPEDAFARITAWESHPVPFTRIRRTAEGFIARTAVGPLGFDDPMAIVDWQPPQFCRIEKRGNVMLGWAEIAVESRPGGCEVLWAEQLSVRGLPGWLDPLVRRATVAMANRILRRTITA